MPALRIKYRKGQDVRFISHLDTARALRRALNRAGIAVAYSQGFSPRPKISFGPRLAVGHLSEVEYADITVAKPIVPQQLADRLNAALPAGLHVLWAGKVQAGSPSVSAAITELEYKASIPWRAIRGGEKGKEKLERALDRFRLAEALVVERERKGRIQRFDLKQQVPMLDVNYTKGGIEVTVRIAVRKAGFPKPEEVLRAVFSLDDKQTKDALITRTDVGFGFTSQRAKGAGRSRYES